jgi:hypothetical protein
MRAARALLLVAGTAVVFALAYLVWPTPYRYLTPRLEPVLAVRINRFTGDADYLLPNGWHSAKVRPGANSPIRLDELLRGGQ